MKKFFRLILVILLSFSTYSLTFAFENNIDDQELLMFFEEQELVIATKHLLSVRKAPAIATVISAKQIQNMGARNILDVLRKVPGIGISVADVTINPAVEIRGIRTDISEKVLFMIDGNALNSALNGTAVPYNYNMSLKNVKQIEVIRGPGSALYGTNAFVAIVNIVTKEAEEMQGVQVTAATGSFNTQRYNIMFGREEDDLKITSHFDYLDTDGPSSFIEQDIDGNSGNTLEFAEQKDFGLKIEYGNITFNSRYIVERNGPYIGVSYALNDESLQHYKNGFASLKYKDTLTDDIDLTAKVYGNITKNDPLWEQHSEGWTFSSYTYADGMTGNPQATGRKLGSELVLDYTLPSHLVTTGFMYEDERQYDVKRGINFHPFTFAPMPFQDVSSWGNYSRDDERSIRALFVQDTWDITDSAGLTTGLRYDHYSDFGETINPRLGFVWGFIENTSLKLLYGTAFRAPAFNETTYINNPVWVGNPSLEPEKIETFEIGLEHDFLEKYTGKINYFSNTINNMIIFGAKPGPTLPRTYENIGKAEVDGIESELLYDFGKGHYGYLNYSYQHPRDGTTGDRLADVPNHRANTGLNFPVCKYLNSNINISWTGKRPRASGDTREALKAYTLVDLTLIARNFYEGLEIRGSVYNVLNEDYRDPSPIAAGVSNDYPTHKRMFLLETKYKF